MLFVNILTFRWSESCSDKNFYGACAG